MPDFSSNTWYGQRVFEVINASPALSGIEINQSIYSKIVTAILFLKKAKFAPGMIPPGYESIPVYGKEMMALPSPGALSVGKRALLILYMAQCEAGGVSEADATAAWTARSNDSYDATPAVQASETAKQIAETLDKLKGMLIDIPAAGADLWRWFYDNRRLILGTFGGLGIIFTSIKLYSLSRG